MAYEKHDDGTTTLTVHAVCDMVVCDDAVITHRFMMRRMEDFWRDNSIFQGE